MSGLVYYIIDTETTGFDANKNEVIEYSIVRCNDRTQLTRIIKAEYPENANPKSLELINKTYADLKKGISKEEAVQDFVSFIEQDKLTPEHRVLVAHNDAFDRRFCHALFRKTKTAFPVNSWLDTKAIAKTWTKKLGIVKPSLTLEASLKHVGIQGVPGKHNALADSQNTYILWYKAGQAGIEYLPLIKRYPANIVSQEELSLEDINMNF